MPTRVGAYIDGFNLYYAGRDHFRPPAPPASWKWLDLRALATSLTGWRGSWLDRVVYCTALRDRGGDPSSPVDQQTYLGALEEHGSVDLIEDGVYVSRIKNGVLLDRTACATSAGPTPSPGLPPSRPASGRSPGSTVPTGTRSRARRIGSARSLSLETLDRDDFVRHQLPETVGPYRRPSGW